MCYELAISGSFYPWMYGQPSVDYFDTDETLKTCWFSGKFFLLSVFFIMMSAGINRQSFAMDFRNNDIIKKCQSDRN